MKTSPASIPVTVIGGFLGAGKTTFLNHVLTDGSARTAVLVNDFGEINIDAALIERGDGTTMTLANGCVCCSIGGSFIQTLGALLDRDTPFDRIVIEASGVGDPWRVAEIALVEPQLRLGCLVVVADAGRIADLVTDPYVGDTVRGQFAKCDVVLLSKSDLVDAAGLHAAREAIVSTHATAPIVVTSRDDLPDLAFLHSLSTHGRFHADDAERDVPDHETTFRRWVYRRDGAFDPLRLTAALAALPPQLLRLKGWCRLDRGDASVLQMVGKSWALVPASSNQKQEPSDIVLVGVGTRDLPTSSELDIILDNALA